MLTVFNYIRTPILKHYNDVIMSAMVSQITGVSIVYSTVCSGSDQRKHRSSASLAFVRVIHRWPVNSLHKGPITRKMFPFNNVIMTIICLIHQNQLRIQVFRLLPLFGKHLRYFQRVRWVCTELTWDVYWKLHNEDNKVPVSVQGTRYDVVCMQAPA